MSWQSDVYVTASNPSPGRTIQIEGQTATATPAFRSDNGLGINVYVAGGMGESGTLPVSGVIEAQFNEPVLVTGVMDAQFTEPVLVSPNSSITGTVTVVSASTGSVQLADILAGRKYLMVFNDSSAVLYLKLGTGASSDSFTTKVMSGTGFEVPEVYTGPVHGAWSSVTGRAMVTEV